VHHCVVTFYITVYCMSYFFVLYSVIALLQYLMLVCTVSFLFEDLLEDRPLQAEVAILHKIKITYIHT